MFRERFSLLFICSFGLKDITLAANQIVKGKNKLKQQHDGTFISIIIYSKSSYCSMGRRQVVSIQGS